MFKKTTVLLGVNIDHVATLRQARGVDYPDPVEAAVLAVKAGADGITLHLREDRRHIQDADLFRMKKALTVPMNLEMAVTEEILRIAETLRPEHCCFVPEKRAELTTEGGLDVVAHEGTVKQACDRLSRAGIKVSLFIDADPLQIQAAKRCGVPAVELTTAQYSEAKTPLECQQALERLRAGAHLADQLGLLVHAGHGLNYKNVQPIAAIKNMHTLNIGHSIIADAVYCGIGKAVKKMKELILKSKN